MKIHNLRDQNLLRHNKIQDLIGDRAILISDSIGLPQLIKILLQSYRKKFIVHALELYSISYRACISEYSSRWSVISRNKFLLFKSCVGFISSIFKVYILRVLANSTNLIIISSEKRRQYLVDEGVRYSIVVVRNKPVLESNQKNLSFIKNKSIIVLIGNMYSARDDFMKVCNFATLNNMLLHCYGLSSDDENWLRRMNFYNVHVFNRVNQEAVTKILKSSLFSLCLYSSDSINNKFSSSSKVFELLYYGNVPIVSSNEGLKHELDSLGAKFIEIDDKIMSLNLDINNGSLLYSELCEFKSELKLLKDWPFNNNLGNDI